MRVRFTYIGEFLEELIQDAHLVEDGILRLTQHYRPILRQPRAMLSVRAGVIIHHKLVELHLPIGRVSRLAPTGTDDAQVQKVAQYFSTLRSPRPGSRCGSRFRP
jgi:hypothetical protein